MDSNSATPFNISDYVNVEFDPEIPPQPPTVSPEEQDTEDLGMSDVINSPIDANAAFGDLTALESALEDSGMTDALQTALETHAVFDDSTVFEATSSTHVVNPAALELPRAPSRWVPIPAPADANPPPSASSQVQREPSRWAPIIPQTLQEPSRWVRASPQLQKHLNTVYAPQLAQLALDPKPPPVLYLPVQQQVGTPLSGDVSSPKRMSTGYGSLQASQPRAEASLIDPSLLVQENERLRTEQRLSNGSCHPTSPTTDKGAPVTERQAFPLIKKRALGANGSKSGPAPKRAKTILAETLPTVAQDDDSDDDDEPVIKRIRTTRQKSSLTVTKDDKSDDHESSDAESDPNHESYDSASSSSSSTPSSRSTPATPNPSSSLSPSTPLLEQPSTLREVQQQQSRFRASTSNAQGKAPTRKMKNLLDEIEDSEGFADAQGLKTGESLERNVVSKRPVRRGARKSYVGLE